MTAKTRAALYAAFETGDVPTGDDFADVIDSSVNLLDENTQNIAGSLAVVGNINAGSITVATLSPTDLSVPGVATLGTTTVDDLTSAGAVSAPSATVTSLITVPTTLAGVGTAQAGAAAISNTTTKLTTSAGQTAFVLPNTAGKFFFLQNSTAVTALIFPPVGGTINGGAANASVNLATTATMLVVALSSTDFWTV